MLQSYSRFKKLQTKTQYLLQILKLLYFPLHHTSSRQSLAHSIISTHSGYKDHPERKRAASPPATPLSTQKYTYASKYALLPYLSFWIFFSVSVETMVCLAGVWRTSSCTLLKSLANCPPCMIPSNLSSSLDIFGTAGGGSRSAARVSRNAAGVSRTPGEVSQTAGGVSRTAGRCSGLFSSKFVSLFFF